MKIVKNLFYKDYLLNIDPIYSISVIGTLYLFFYMLIHFARNELLIAIVELIVIIFSIFNLTFYIKTKNKEVVSNIILAGILLFFDFLLIDGGLEKTGIYWIFVYPTLAFFLKDRLIGIYWNLAFVLSIIILLFLDKHKIVNLTFSEEKVILALVTYSAIFIIMVFIKSNISFNYEKIEKLATTDSLTGIYNRFQILKLLKTEIEKALRYNKTFSIILFDIDNFKSINDNYGHQKGDYVLKKVTEIFSKNIRKTDYFGRLGGEEFIIITPEIDAKSALIVAEKLRKLLEKSKFDDVGQITASFGISEFEKGKDVNQLLKEADDALYLAKRKGKNRVCIYNSECE